jgi:membrane protein DedA with SNARE-associated domain
VVGGSIALASASAEVISCLAGLTRMPLPIFAASLACGALPMGFVYAAIGAAGQDNPTMAILLSIVVPPLLWLVARRWVILRRR